MLLDTAAIPLFPFDNKLSDRQVEVRGAEEEKWTLGLDWWIDHYRHNNALDGLNLHGAFEKEGFLAKVRRSLPGRGRRGVGTQALLFFFFFFFFFLLLLAQESQPCGCCLFLNPPLSPFSSFPLCASFSSHRHRKEAGFARRSSGATLFASAASSFTITKIGASRPTMALGWLGG